VSGLYPLPVKLGISVAEKLYLYTALGSAAEQDTGPQVHVQLFPLATAFEAVPTEQRFAVGATTVGIPFAEPQTPLGAAALEAEQFIGITGPFIPCSNLQVQLIDEPADGNEVTLGSPTAHKVSFP